MRVKLAWVNLLECYKLSWAHLVAVLRLAYIHLKVNHLAILAQGSVACMLSHSGEVELLSVQNVWSAGGSGEESKKGKCD